MAKLYIAMYEQAGNYEHWALFLDEGSEKTIFEVIGEHPNFVIHVLKGNPKSSRRYKRDILVGVIEEQDIAEVKATIEKAKIDNETVEWNCQDFCVEALDELVEGCFIDENDEDYIRGRKAVVDKYFGPM